MGISILNPKWAPSEPIRGVLFDLDGVVLDTEKLYSRFWQEAAQSLGFPMTRAQALGMRSLNRSAGAEQIQRYFGPEADYHRIRNRRIQLMDAYIAENGVELMNGIHALLDALDLRGIPAAITSSSPPERICQYLSQAGLLDRFQKICSVYQITKGKPEPDIYLYGAQQLGADPRLCLALEDSPVGILSAYRAGCLPVFIPDQDEPDEETLPRLYALADSLADVISLL